MGIFEFVIIAFLGLAILSATGISIHDRLPKHMKKPVGKSNPAAGLSYTSQFIYQKYMELPASVRTDDIVPGLKALDVEYPEVDTHGIARKYYKTHEFSTPYRSCRCEGAYKKYCPLKEYRQVYRGISNLSDSIARQKKKLALSEVAYDKESIMALSERLKVDANIVDKVTRELC